VTSAFLSFVVLGRTTARRRRARGEARPFQGTSEREPWGIV
jgi:hypothetical protein